MHERGDDGPIRGPTQWPPKSGCVTKCYFDDLYLRTVDWRSEEDGTARAKENEAYKATKDRCRIVGFPCA